MPDLDPTNAPSGEPTIVATTHVDGQARYVLSDGATFPLVRGGDGPDGFGDGPLDPSVPHIDTPPSAAPPAPAPAPAAPAPADAAGDPFDTGADVFDRAYVEKVRQEAAKYRTEAKPFKEAFDGYSDDDRAALLEFTRLLKDDPAAAAEWMRTQAEHLSERHAPPPPDPAADQPLTRAELERTLAEREQHAREAQALAAIHSEARELGYDPEATDHDARLAFMNLTFLAAEVTGGDLAKAHELRQGQQAKAVQDFLDRKSREAADTPDPSPQAGGAAPASQPPKTWAEARKQLEARLNSAPVG